MSSRRRGVTIRPRRPSDVTPLCEVLARQQPTSGYPIEWPLPFPVEDFIARDKEEGAWTAVLEGRPVGHISVRTVVADPDGMAQCWSDAASVGIDRLAGVAALFVDVGLQGEGIGGALLDVAESWMSRRAGCRCSTWPTPTARLSPSIGTGAVDASTRGTRVAAHDGSMWMCMVCAWRG